MKNKWEAAGLAAYAGLYLFMWNVLMRNFTFPVVRVCAFLWILSGLAAVLLARVRKQGLFISTFIGSMLGPLGIIVILAAKPDLRVYLEEEKTREFYNKIFRDLEMSFLRIIPNKVALFKSVDLPYDFGQICAYFGAKVKTGARSRSVSIRQYIDLFRQIYVKFDEEYNNKFASKFPGIGERLSSLDKKAEEYDRAMAAYIEKNRKSLEFKAGFLNFLGVVFGGLSVLIGLAGTYYLFFTEQKPPLLIEGALSIVLAFMSEGDTGTKTWVQIRSANFLHGFGFVLLLIAGAYALLSIFVPDFTERVFKKKRKENEHV